MHGALPWLALLAALAVLGWLLSVPPPPPGSPAAPGAVLPSAAPLSVAGDTAVAGGVAWQRYALLAVSLTVALVGALFLARMYMRWRNADGAMASWRNEVKAEGRGAEAEAEAVFFAAIDAIDKKYEPKEKELSAQWIDGKITLDQYTAQGDEIQAAKMKEYEEVRARN
jgi:hypothetical protein